MLLSKQQFEWEIKIWKHFKISPDKSIVAREEIDKVNQQKNLSLAAQINSFLIRELWGCS